MRIYIAGRAKTRTSDILEIRKRLRSMGHKIVYDWDPNKVRRPYRKPTNRQHNIKTQAEMLEAAAKADIFIFLDESGLRGAYIELGAFLHEATENPKNKKVCIVGPKSYEREHIFESPEYVLFVNDIDEVYSDLSE